MSRRNNQSSSKQPATQENQYIDSRLIVYSASGATQKLDIIAQLMLHIKSNEEQIRLLKDSLQASRKAQQTRVNKGIIYDLNMESIKTVKQSYDKSIQKLNGKINELNAQCHSQQTRIKKYQQEKNKYAQSDHFLEFQQQQTQAKLNLRKAIMEKRLLQDRCKVLEEQNQNKNDEYLKLFYSKVDQLKIDYDKLLQENKSISQKHNNALVILENQKKFLQKENNKLKASFNQFSQKLKQSKKFTSRLVKFIAKNGQKQTDFEKKVSKIKESQLEDDIMSGKDNYEKEIENVVSNLYDRNRVNRNQKQSLSTQLRKVSDRVKQLEYSLNSQKEKLEKASQELKNTKTKLNQITSTLQKRNVLIQGLNKDITLKQTQLTALNQKYSQLGYELQVQKQKCKQEIKLKQTALADNQKKQIQISELRAKNEKLEIHVSILNTQIGSKNVQINGLNSSVKAHLATIQSLNKKADDLNTNILILQGRLSALILRGKELDKVIQQLKAKNKVLSDKNGQIQQKLQISEGNYNTLNIQHKNLKEKERQLLSGFKQLSKIYNKCLIEPITYAFLGKAIKIDEPRPERVGDIERDLQQVGQSLRYTLRASKYFNNSRVLNEVQVDFLIDAVESYTKRNVQNSFLLYRYDTINPINFHNYIDKKQNLLLVIKLANGYVIGGFTEYAIDKARIEKPGSGFIFNCNTKKSYYVKNDARLPVVSYDDYFCLFGNAEIRLKSQEAKMFSNFGISASTFETGREQRTKFLNIENSNDNQLDLETYEFYQITFKR